MAATYQLISSQTLGSAAASVTFSSIPSTYTDLVLKISAGSAVVAATDSLQMQLNGDTNTNYSFTKLSGNGSAAASSRVTTTNTPAVGLTDGSTSTANVFASTEIYIPNYNSTSGVQINGFGATENNGSAADIAQFAYLWRGAAAVTSIKLQNLTANNFITGSTFYLYGIKNA